MRPALRTAARITAWTAAGAAGVAGVATAASAVGLDSGTSGTSTPASVVPAATSNPSPGGQSGPNRSHILLGKLLHGTFVVQGRDGKVHTEATQRGTVTALSAASISLRSSDGFTDTYVVSAATKVRKDATQVKITDLKTGETVSVLAEVNGQTKTAQRVVTGAAKGNGRGWRGYWRHRSSPNGSGSGSSGSSSGSSGSSSTPSSGELPAQSGIDALSA